jgi:hypothetical protein
MKLNNKIYTSGRTYVMWTGEGNSEKTFSGIVVKQLDQESEHKVGMHSKDWSKDLFKETDEKVPNTWRLWHRTSQLEDTLWTIAISIIMVGFFVVMAIVRSK